MAEIVKIEISEIMPDRSAVLINQGIPEDSKPLGRIDLLFRNALELFQAVCEPKGIISEISTTEFDEVYRGEGRNEPDNPIDRIFRTADYLALFAATLGEAVSRRITDLFSANDFALGYMLDSVASEGADKAAALLEDYFHASLKRKGVADNSTAVLGYSPGYCGWHISGQKRLFEYLEPGQIGIRLNRSYLMQPLKSVSGVLIAGEKEIHEFDNSYPFCEQCDSKRCRVRIQSVHDL